MVLFAPESLVPRLAGIEWPGCPSCDASLLRSCIQNFKELHHPRNPEFGLFEIKVEDDLSTNPPALAQNLSRLN
jgi:hypothetical protein